MKIAVIGAGLSGLAVALHLRCKGIDVTVFDKGDRVGGNVDTLSVDLGGETRWADMGVNDFNAATYTNIVAMLDELKVPYKLLEDTCSFSTLDGSISYTLDDKWNTEMPRALRQEYNRFERTAAHDVINNPKYKNYTVAQYLAEKEYSADFARLNILPRINGMYFAHDTTPATMPIRGVMHYYTLQEGFGNKAKPRRMYFAHGSSSWIEALAKAAGANVVLNADTRISASGDNVIVHTDDGDETYDAAVIACHAGKAMQLFRSGVTQQMVSVLSAFEYCNSVAVAHTFAPLLPPDKNAWRTYNILIHDNFEQLRPYTISYVCNLHQNDPHNPKYNRFNNPYFFVTLNPSVAIPDEYVLRTTDGNKAVSYYPHNVFNLDAMAAQGKLPKIQGQNNVYFTGGWTKGAGLQEECWLSAQHVADLILDAQAHDAHAYNTAHDAEHYAPHYLRTALAG